MVNDPQKIQEITQKLNLSKESLMDVQYKIARLTKVDKPKEVPDYFYEILITMCNSLDGFCAQQRVFLNMIEDRIKKNRI